MAERPTSKNTKAEILKMYDELLRENAQLEATVQTLQQEKQELEKAKQKPAAAKVSGGTAPAAVDASTLDGVMNTLSALRPGFGDAVSELSAKLLAEASKLAELRENVAKEQQQLEVLHDFTITDDTLQQLLREYAGKSAEFEQERTQQQQAFEQKMHETRKAWQKEQEEHVHSIKERDENVKKAEQREAAEYAYNLEHRRKLDVDQYDQQQQQLHQALEEVEANQKKAWAEREKRIADQERECAELQHLVDTYPKELETAVKKARGEGTEMARRQAKIAADLREKDAEGELRLYERKIQSFEETRTKQLEHIKSLSTQLDATINQAQALALRAIEGASSAGSLQAVKEIALEQAKTIQKGK